jgi:vitamin B12 transporter
MKRLASLALMLVGWSMCTPVWAGPLKRSIVDDEVAFPELLSVERNEGRPLCAHGFIDLIVVVDATGAVTEADPQQSDEHEAVQAAVAHVRALKFKPALRSGEPVASRIRYRFYCAINAPPTPHVAVEPESEPQHHSGDALGQSGSGRQMQESPARLEVGASSSQEVLVVGQTTAERLTRGANAVSVVELTSQRQRTGTLGEVLSRQEGASVRTMGGLGGFTRFSLDGLSNEQVRFFIDGVPLRFAGYSLGIANVPVDQIKHVEIYHGVVPARFGADALGGAVNLETLDTANGSSATASVSTGSFETTRLSGSASHRDRQSGYLVRANGFYDTSRNNFVVKDVPVVDAQGRVSKTSRPHFHNKYNAKGIGVDLGVTERPWAKQLLVRGYYSDHAKQIPHDDVGTDNQNPYGEVNYGRTASGVLLMHRALVRNVRVDSRVGFSNERVRFSDTSRCSYDWYGRCAVTRRSRGEVSAIPTDASLSDQFWFARIDGDWLLAPNQELRVSVAPTHSTRRGRDAVILEQVPDPLRAKRRFLTSVVGAEYELRSEEDLWKNNLFAKWYSRYLDASEVLPNGNPRVWDEAKHYGGLGNGVRVNFTDNIFAKASYEYALRFPSIEEIFGDGGQIVDNLELAAERSHNFNLELHARTEGSGGSTASVVVRGFGRLLQDRIWLQAVTGYSVYDNVDHSRVLGGEAVVQWVIPGKWLSLSANGTWLHSRDTSGKTAVRLPNDPGLWINTQATFTKTSVVTNSDSANLDWNVNYVHDFPLSVGERGAANSRLRVDAQTVHTAALRYVLEGEHATVSTVAELNNVMDAKIMDFYGVQRPGRAFFLKLTLQARSTPNQQDRQ